MIDSRYIRMPLVSVIITNRNYEQYVCLAIQSVADQSYKKFECVIIDDCSIDNSFATISTFLLELNDPRFRCIRLGSNLGQMAAIKAGLENTSGEFVSSLDADDLWLPTFLQTHIAAHLNSSFSAGMSASDTFQIDENGTVLEGTYHGLVKHRSDDPNGHTRLALPASVPAVETDTIEYSVNQGTPSVFYIDRALVGWHYSAMSSLMFRRSLLDIIIPADMSHLKLCADYYLALFCHWITGSITIGQSHSCFRMHGKNNFSSNKVLGGQYYAPGNFSPTVKASVEKAIADHIIGNIDRFQNVLGLEYCVVIIRRMYAKKNMYKAAKGSPTLRLHLGRGSERKFRMKYRFYRLVGKR
jgi:glycosyltransferase involved in cell wall biosynthesis